MSDVERKPGSRASSRLLGPRLVAGALVALAIFLIWSALGVARGGGYSVIGPGTIPLVVAIGLLVLAGALLVRTTLVPDADLGELARAEEEATHWPTVGLLGAAMVVYAVALNGVELGPVSVPGVGYVLATGIFLPASARILGSRQPVRDTLIGFGLAIAVFIGFTEFLGVRLPPGVLDVVR